MPKVALPRSRDWAELVRYFGDEIFPVLTPLAVDPSHPFPYISDLSLSLAVTAPLAWTGLALEDATRDGPAIADASRSGAGATRAATSTRVRSPRRSSTSGSSIS